MQVSQGRGLRGPVRVVAAIAAWSCGIAGVSALQPIAEPLAPGAAPAAQPEQAGIDIPKYPVSRFVLRYAAENPGHPAPEDILQARVTLGIGAGGYVQAREGVATVTLRVSDIAEEPMRRFSLLALTDVVKAVFEEFKRRGIIGVVVDASEDVHLPMRRDPATGRYELDTADPRHGEDLRKASRPEAPTEFHMVVYTGVVTSLRTQATGERIPSEERIDNPRHAFIRERSPVQPATPGAAGERRDLLRKDRVDEFMYRLNRHPGRRVDASISAGENEGEIALDYLVNESKPWAVYAQVSNTGTEETDEWRERFGFTHNQLTGNDDILSLDYITASFDETNAVLGSYEAPLGGSEWWRWKVFGNWNEYTASDVGFAGEQFEGEGWTAGAELIWNFFQHEELFLDGVAGLRWQTADVNNVGLGTTGTGDFLLPSIGVRLERQTDLSTTLASIGLEGNLAGAAGTDLASIQNLGRLDVDDEWAVIKFDAYHSFFLDPVLDSKWEDPSSGPTLAHELALIGRGQWALDYRLVPNFQQVVGGLYTVRGYPESSAAGDTVLVGTVEYRFHIPWALRQDPQPRRMFGRQFRFFPQQPYGRSDWDFVIRAFMDAGYAKNNDRQAGEDDETLIGAGLGAELVFRRNLSVRLDWGIALHDTEAGQTVNGEFSPDWTAGRSRVHLVATILY